ncbi:MAG: amidohydrolase [Pirellulaceae bacterium]
MVELTGWPAILAEENICMTESTAALHELMLLVDDQVAHIWMVRTFLKHSDEAAEDDELASVHRDLYDFMLALGPSLDSGDAASYLKLAKKKLAKLRRAVDLFTEIQPEISGHMNFKMAARSLNLALAQITNLLNQQTPVPHHQDRPE